MIYLRFSECNIYFEGLVRKDVVVQLGVLSYQIRSIFHISVLSWNNVKWVVISMITTIFGRCVIIICVWYIFLVLVVFQPLGNILTYSGTTFVKNMGKIIYWQQSVDISNYCYNVIMNNYTPVLNFSSNLFPNYSPILLDL